MAIFPTKANRFAFLPRTKRESFILVVRVLCKPYSYKWFPSRLT